jgi:hypothetical protein
MNLESWSGTLRTALYAPSTSRNAQPDRKANNIPNSVRSVWGWRQAGPPEGKEYCRVLPLTLHEGWGRPRSRHNRGRWMSC